MKNSILVLVGALLVSSLSFGQKKNETSAAVEFKNKYAPAMQSGDMEIAKKTILSAKEYIDLAAEHPDTKESAKTLYYKGEIYVAIADLADRKADSDLSAMVTDAFLQQAVESIKKAHDDKKWSSDAGEASYRARFSLDKQANGKYKADKFSDAARLYQWQEAFASAVGVIDSAAIYYGAACSEQSGDFTAAAIGFSRAAKLGYRGAPTYSYASGAYRKAGDNAKSKAIIAEGRAKYPNNRDLLLELVNINIDENNPTGAEAALNAAIAADPKNKQLYYTIGTIYIELKENEKAEAALNKALEIDPAYMDAQYQLGAHLVSWGGDLKTEASNLKFGDAQYEVMLSQSTDVYQRAAAPLENYITANPGDAAILNILFQLHRSLGNADKAAEYKARAAEAK